MAFCTLSACQTMPPPKPPPPPEIKTIFVYPTATVDLTCAKEPAIGNVMTDNQFAQWTESLRMARSDCDDKLKGVREWVESWPKGPVPQ